LRSFKFRARIKLLLASDRLVAGELT